MGKKLLDSANKIVLDDKGFIIAVSGRTTAKEMKNKKDFFTELGIKKI